MMEGFTTFQVTQAYVLYDVNTSYEGYRNHVSFKTAKSAKSAARVLKSYFGDDTADTRVYISKVIGFLHRGYIYGTNGFKYSVDTIDENEKQLALDDVTSLLSLFIDDK